MDTETNSKVKNRQRMTMTIPEFAEATGCSKNLAYSLARQDKLPVQVIKLGSKLMVVSRKAVERLLSDSSEASHAGG